MTLRDAIETVRAEHPSASIQFDPGDANGTRIGEQERTVIEEGRETPLEHSSGLGLWLVAWIVRTAGGTIRFETADTGITVVVQLPPTNHDEN
ncbi:MAG: hypothetical protein ABEJ47_01835 [Halorhabdus sp.]